MITGTHPSVAGARFSTNNSDNHNIIVYGLWDKNNGVGVGRHRMGKGANVI